MDNPDGPGDGAEPVGADEGGDFFGGEVFVLRDLDEGGGGPSEGEKESGQKLGLPAAEIEAGGAGRGFEEHEGSDDVGHLFHVAGVVVVEGFAFKGSEKRVDGDLDDPEDASHGSAGDELDDEESGEHRWIIWLIS